MDSGLGSDEDRRGRTKEQKQLRNQQLLSGCFIDAANLSDDAEVDQRRSDERRQGALLFQTSVPHFSMLQMSHSQEEASNCSGSSGNLSQYPDTNTPYNSIVQLDTDEPETTRKSPLGFYVDLSDVPDTPKSQPSCSATKNIFSMVIDFEGPKKEKPVKLTSSYGVHKRSKLAKSNLSSKANGSLSSSMSSVNSLPMAGTSRQSEEQELKPLKTVNCEVFSASLIKKLSVSSKSSSSSENIEKINDDSAKESVEEEHIDYDISEKEENHENGNIEKTVNMEDTQNTLKRKSDNKQDCLSNENSLETQQNHPFAPEMACVVEPPILPPAAAPAAQFVKLSDLECQKPTACAARIDLAFTPRMSRSIPESSWVESPLMMSNSVGYRRRSAPKPMLEPEEHSPSGSDSMSQSTGTESSTCQPKKMVRRLGTDLLRMFLEEISPDVTVEVEGHKLKAHKCILASRCQYFAALVSGNWLEKSGNVISLQGFSYESVYFALCHIYSGAAHVPDSISLVELASLADMLGLEGLKEVVEHALKVRHCHNFHRPCAGCCTGVLEVLPLSAAYGLDDLYQRCLQWITQHFVRVWPSRAFASLPRELREKCYRQHVVHMTPERVLETMVQCEKVLATLPSMRWAEPVSQLVLQLTDACHLYHRQHFAAVLGSRYVTSLDTGLGFGVSQVEEQMLTAAKNLGVEQACKSYTRCCKMLSQSWSRPFGDMLNKIKAQLEQCLVSQADRLIRSNAWLRLDTALRTRIKELTPTLEPASRLPRATSLRPKKSTSSASVKSTSSTLSAHHQIVSSSDSSRNSSPSTAYHVPGAKITNGNVVQPSLRRSLLLAAKQPQQQQQQVVVANGQPKQRTSTLTQPTAASAAKSAAARIAREARQAAQHRPPATRATQQKMTATVQPMSRTSPSSVGSSGSSASRNISLGKKEPLSNLPPRRPQSRSSSPLKSDSSRTSSPRKLDSRVTSPIKTTVKTPPPPKEVVTGGQTKGRKATATATKIVSSSGQAKTGGNSGQAKPTLQRSSTFLKDEPTVLGKVI